MLMRLFYVSRTAQPMNTASLQALVGAAQLHNRRTQITGILAFTGEHFAQMLEGDPNEVDPLMDRIAVDSRHTRVAVLYRINRTNYREFPGWSMQLLNSPKLNDALGHLVAHPQTHVAEVKETIDRIVAMARWFTADDVHLPSRRTVKSAPPSGKDQRRG